MAEGVKVQGNVDHCLQALGEYARQYDVTYIASFGTAGQKDSQLGFARTYSIGTGTKSIPIHFMWRFEYNEYDNSS